MRFAIFSDIHANLQAWDAVLADIQKQGVDTLVCLGDVVGYGPMPGPVLESVYQHTDNFVLGNHDAVIGGRIDAATFNEHARYVIEWTAEQLGEDGAAFFAQVPLTLRGEKMLFTHGDAARPGHFDYVAKAEDARPSFQACKDDVIFFGHTHDPGIFACKNNKGIIDKLPGEDVVLNQGRRYMINPGSVGDPRSAADLRACYCVYDDTTRRLSFRKVEFDAEAYRADLEASGLEMLPYFLRVIDAGSRRPEEEEELAIVQDHREEVEVDESLTVQPRALVTVGSPMANRPKLHFGYAHPRQHGYAPPPQAPRPHTRPIHQHPVPPKQKNGLAILIVGVLIGIVGLIFAFSNLSGPSDTDRADVDAATVPSEKKKSAELLSTDDGWEDADETKTEDKPEGEGGEIVDFGKPPVFSLSALVDKPFEKYGVELPDGVKLISTEFGGEALHFGGGTKPVVITGVDEVNFGGSISVAAWIKVQPENYERVIFGRATGSELPLYLKITSAKSSKPGCVVFGGEGLQPESVRSSSRKRVDDGEWHFVMGMHDEKEGKLRVYLDGVISKAANSRGTFPHLTAPISIGIGDFNGDIYGLRVFDWPLHTKDMKKIYERNK